MISFTSRFWIVFLTFCIMTICIVIFSKITGPDAEAIYEYEESKMKKFDFKSLYEYKENELKRKINNKNHYSYC